MQTSAFRTREDEKRYRKFFEQDQRFWKLHPDEHAAAEVILDTSPTLGAFPEILNHDIPGLDMHAVSEVAQQGATVRTTLAAALIVVTVPNLAWAYVGDPAWSTLVGDLAVEDLEALAAARRRSKD